MKQYHVRVGVITDAAEQPLKVKYLNSWYDVIECIDMWEDSGEWWNKESEKTFYRVILIDGSVLEIYKDMPTEEWWSNKVHQHERR